MFLKMSTAFLREVLKKRDLAHNEEPGEADAEMAQTGERPPRPLCIRGHSHLD